MRFVIECSELVGAARETVGVCSLRLQGPGAMLFDRIFVICSHTRLSSCNIPNAND